MKRILALVMGAMALVGGLGVLGAGPAFGDSTGTVTATVTVQGVPCVLLGTSNVNYGTLNFSSGTTSVTAVSPQFSIQNCSTATETLLARGTDAHSTTTADTWALSTTFVPSTVAPCSSLPLNTFRHVAAQPISPGIVPLTTTDVFYDSLAAGQTGNATTVITMPCQGSVGAGQTMTTDVIITATVP